MITWTLIKSEAGDGHYQTAEPGRNWRLSVGPLPVEGATRPSQDVRWCIQERSAATGKFIDAEDGDCSSFEDGQAAAEDAYRRLQRPIGRPLKGKRPTTSTERSKQRMDRLTATEEAAAEQRQQLAKFREDLAAAGLDDYADSVAMISGFTAIKAVAKYTRRNSFSFVTNGPQMPGGEERAQRQQKITAQADAMDMLAARLIREPIEYQSFQNILDELHGIGFRPDNSLVSYVAGALVPVSEPSPLTRAERLRRVVILCCNFTRNLAYYHAGQREKALLVSFTPPGRVLATGERQRSGYLCFGMVQAVWRDNRRALLGKYCL